MSRFVFIALLLLAGCKQVPMLPSLTAYKMDIQQGNFVTQEMAAKLRPGMTRSQVRFLLGTPLVVDPFRTDRWDYVYVFQRQGNVVEQRRIVVVFQEDKLLRVDGDVVPAQQSGDAQKPPPGIPAREPITAPPAEPAKPAP
jgi:outer membrane protein assembly factor BamE